LRNLLFVCSKNQWRSPTAESLFKGHPQFHARSTGTSEKARIKVNEKLINCADVIFVMERKHKEIICQKFPASLENKQIVILNIADDYTYADEELVQILRGLLDEYLNIK
jgi:predicted protein tyrosine phosphatase